MNEDEIVEKFFMQDFIDENSSKMKEVLSHVKKFTKEFKVSVRKTSIDDAIKKKKDKNYKIDCEIKLLEDGIELPFPCSGFLEELKKHIPNTVEKVSLPISMYTDLPNFFTRFSNLKTIGISNYGKFEYEELEDIYKYSNVTDIEDSAIYFTSIQGDAYLLSENYQKVACKYKNIDIHYKGRNPGKMDNVLMETNNINYEQILEVLSRYPNINKLQINLPNDIEYEFVIEDKNITFFHCNNNDPISIGDFYDFFTQNGYNVPKITFSINSKEKSYYDIDYSILDKLNKKVDISVKYDSLSSGSYEQFRTMIDGINWYKSIINDYGLSPVEKLTMAYDIMKTFQYREVGKGEDKSISRNPNTIMETGNIVCVGYTSMLQEIFKELDSNIKMDAFSVTCYDEQDKKVGDHSRSIVRIDDDKYNIHGIYALDATWDSVKSNGKEVLGDDYDALSLYHYFLVPIPEYKETFKYDSAPHLFENDLKKFNEGINRENLEKQEDLDNEELSDFSNIIPNLFDKKITKKDVVKYLNARKISFEEILSIVYNTRKAEGYTGEYLENEIEKVRRINSRYYGIDTSIKEENGKQI